ncbi:MAG: hypothetical protein U0800_26010 [Isosphaeraceae bacterium]
MSSGGKNLENLSVGIDADASGFDRDVLAAPSRSARRSAASRRRSRRRSTPTAPRAASAAWARRSR